MAIAGGVFIKVILVIFLRFIEVLEGLQFNCYFAIYVLLLFDKYLFDYLLILWINIINACSILSTTVVALLVDAGWINRLKV